jgi:hypothetical protein
VARRGKSLYFSCCVHCVCLCMTNGLVNGPHSELEILRCISQTRCRVYTNHVAEGVYYLFSESISQWCEWWLNNEWIQPRSLTPGEISELIVDTDSKEARMSSDGITDIERAGGGGR